MKSQCPCGNTQELTNCCLPFIKGEYATTPEQLMRSRYTAYTLGEIDYIEKTMESPAKDRFDAKDALKWSKDATWLSLEVVAADPITAESQKATVSFLAKYEINKELEEHFEQSVFEKIGGKWFYTDDLSDPEIKEPASSEKIGRNQACPCGSGKKYKQCCINQ